MSLIRTIIRRLPQTTFLRNQTPVRGLSGQAAAATDNNHIPVTFIQTNGKKVTVKGKLRRSLFDVLIENNLGVDGFGACNGTLCCASCHLIFNATDYQKVGPPEDDEMDMLDTAHGVTDTSRLGCQVLLRKEMEQLEVKLPL